VPATNLSVKYYGIILNLQAHALLHRYNFKECVFVGSMVAEENIRLSRRSRSQLVVSQLLLQYELPALDMYK